MAGRTKVERTKQLLSVLNKARTGKRIAGMMKDAGVKGRVGDPHRCVLFRYFKKQGVTADTIDSRCIRFNNPQASVNIPKNVVKFMSMFDYGKFPEITTTR